jgi:hypothetical protein
MFMQTSSWMAVSIWILLALLVAGLAWWVVMVDKKIK